MCCDDCGVLAADAISPVYSQHALSLLDRRTAQCFGGWTLFNLLCRSGGLLCCVVMAFVCL